jgi:hypothetical protein
MIVVKEGPPNFSPFTMFQMTFNRLVLDFAGFE